MFYREESPLMPLLRLAAMGASYYLGKYQGRNEVIEKAKEMQRDEEIAALRRQLNGMKK